jgi:hypothetical protein
MYLLRPPNVSTPLDRFGEGWGYYAAFVALPPPWGGSGRLAQGDA